MRAAALVAGAALLGASGAPAAGADRAASAFADLLPRFARGCAAAAPAPAPAERSSIYVPAGDGVKLAVDVFLPSYRAPGARLPASFTATRYWRAAKDGALPPEQQAWIAAGFAVVNADVRGTGASFGRWHIPYSEQEDRDIGFLAAWIARQAWSDGKVVMTGNSYTGTTSLIGPAYAEGAVKAIAPKFSDFDMFTDLLFPGGVAAEDLSIQWGRMVRELDLDRAPGGVRPVDGPDAEALLRAAVAEHAKDPEGFERVPYRVTFADQRVPEYHDMAMQEGGVYRLKPRIEASGAPIFGWGSWLDSGIAQGLVNRFMNFRNPQLTVIGPWTHGAREDVNVLSPGEKLDPSREEQASAIRCYLTHYVHGAPGAEQPDHTLIYFTMGEDRWKESHEWPIRGTRIEKLYLDRDHALSEHAPKQAGVDRYRVDFDASVGPANRWATQADGPRVDYGDRRDADRRLLVYTGPPLREDTELTGQPVVHLEVTSTHTDGNFFAYLEDVAPDGRVTYLTEGQLRALHRRISKERPPYRTTYPHHSFRERDAEPLVPGQAAMLAFQLQATSVRLRRGHRIRLAIAGADRGTFLRWPPAEQGEVTIGVSRGAPRSSYVELPIVPGQGTAYFSAAPRLGVPARE